MDAFTSMPDVVKITGKGETKSSVLLAEGLAADLRVLPQKSFGAALQYFTGSVEHNVRLRQLALKKGFTLSEYGLFTVKGKKYVCGRSEEEIYRKIGVPFVPPEIRENAGEFDLKKVPALIPYDSLKGDLHMHTKWSEGLASPEEMIEAARTRGYDYLGITDHSKSEIQAHGMEEKRLLQYVKALRKLQEKSDVRVFISSEVDILSDGSLDYSDRLLEQLDIVVAAVHSGFKMDAKKMTQRLVKAISNEHVTILAHPTGRLINIRQPFSFDVDKVFQTAKDNDVLLEINANPPRLDLNDVLCRHAKNIGCRFVINTDAHHPDQLAFAEYGIATARRGWLEKEDVVNTLPLKKFEKALRK
jgi:DNA polymerase (family 10)